MMCALTAAQRGRKVLLLDHNEKLAEKIRISGGGRCNFTHLNTRAENYLSENPHFCRSALTRFTPQQFTAILQKYSIGFHEKSPGQLFCDDGSEAIIAMLKSECDAGGVHWCLPCAVDTIGQLDSPVGLATDKGSRAKRFAVTSSRGRFETESLVIATGGLSIPKMGATAFGYKIAQQFGIAVSKLKPGLVPLSFHPEEWAQYADLAGISVDALVSFGKHSFRENLLFTHRGLSGPAILQISSYWEPGKPLSIDLLPPVDILQAFRESHSSRMLLNNFMAYYLPKRLADVWCGQLFGNKPLNQYAEKSLSEFSAKLHAWQITPTGTLGYNKAEVTCGGVDTRSLSSKTMEANQVPGLYFIGEVVDVTGQLGGYNFQWAWASGYAAGLAA
jgi:predicted Rossmann fold flavoprotein